MGKWVYREDCEVVRGHQDYPRMAVLMDCDGEVLFVVPESWEDHQLFIALDFANDAFCEGEKRGKDKKIREIKKTLEI